MGENSVTFEFGSNIFMLQNINEDKQKQYETRYDIISNNMSKEKINDDNDSIYIYGMLPIELMPAAYIPFRFDNMDFNFNILTENKVLEDYLASFKGEINSHNLIEFKQNLKKILENCLTNRIYNPLSIFNSFNINIMIIFTAILWSITIIVIMKFLHYYYNDIYSYILFVFMILLLIFGVVWKMFYTLQ